LFFLLFFLFKNAYVKTNGDITSRWLVVGVREGGRRAGGREGWREGSMGYYSSWACKNIENEIR
jgi:hypothetical protein